MIPIKILKQVTVVYVHAHCPDGLASAMILKDAFRMLGMSPRIEFLAHDTPEHRLAGWGDGMFALFCDIAPHPEAVEGRMIGQFSGPLREMPGIVLDHHKGAREIVEAFGELGIYADAEKEPGVSGAVLAFREVWMVAQEHREDARRDCGTAPVTVQDVKTFAESVGARDTWQTSHPLFLKGQWACKLLMSKTANYWLDLGPALVPGDYIPGRALFEAHMNAVREAVDQCVYYLVPSEAGAQVHMAVYQEQSSGFRLNSDVAEFLRERDEDRGTDPDWKYVDLVVGFYFFVDKPGGDPRAIFSLRGSHGFDVCAFAKANGGGGHQAAASFSVPADLGGHTPYEYARRALAAFLGSE